MSCIFCKGSGCGKCKGSGWIEIMGAGMVHPRVLQGVAIDPEEYTGFAFGLGHRPRGACSSTASRTCGCSSRATSASCASSPGAREVLARVARRLRGRRRGRRRRRRRARCSTRRASRSSRSRARGADAILDAEITPNRPDAMGHRGLAREIAAMAGIPMQEFAARYAEPEASGEATEQAGLDRAPGARALPPFRRAHGARHRHGARAGARARPARRDRREVDLGRGGRDELRPLGHGPAAARLRLRQARGRPPDRPQGAQGREARHARRRRARARVLRRRRGRRRARGVARRDHGRPRHGRDRGDDATCCSRPPGGTRRPSAARRGASGCTRTRRTASSAARTSTRSPERSTWRRACSSSPPAARSPRACSTRTASSSGSARTALRLSRLRLLSGRLAPRPRLRRGGPRPPRVHARAQGQAPLRLDPALPHGRAPRGRPRRGSPPGLRLRPPALAPAARHGRRAR